MEIKSQKREERTDKIRTGWKILLTGWIGLDGMLCILEKKQEELRQRFAPAFLMQAEAHGRDEKCCSTEEMEELTDAFVLPVGEGGILAALWNLAKETGTGIALDMKKFSILQETIEVCEMYRLNPYQLRSGGCFLVVTDQESRVKRSLEAKGIKVSVIGEITDNNDKVIRNGEDLRYIDRPAPDELAKIL
nr:AIR synthase-related protein [uncultured Merdimonas sp.]